MTQRQHLEFLHYFCVFVTAQAGIGPALPALGFFLIPIQSTLAPALPIDDGTFLHYTKVKRISLDRFRFQTMKK